MCSAWLLCGKEAEATSGAPICNQPARPHSSATTVCFYWTIDAFALFTMWCKYSTVQKCQMSKKLRKAKSAFSEFSSTRQCSGASRQRGGKGSGGGKQRRRLKVSWSFLALHLSRQIWILQFQEQLQQVDLSVRSFRLKAIISICGCFRKTTV